MAFDLANNIIESKTIETEYPGCDELVLTLAHLTRDELMKLRKNATTTKFNKKTRQQEDDVDSELFQDMYIKAVVVGWEGFKYKYLTNMLPVDTSSLSEEEWCGVDTDGELGNPGDGMWEYTKDNAATLMRNSSDFDNWISAELEDIENFTKTS